MAGYVPRRGDLVWLRFSPQAGHEQAGHRPALVISAESYNRLTGLALFCPITNKRKGYALVLLLGLILLATYEIKADTASLPSAAKLTEFKPENGGFSIMTPVALVDQTSINNLATQTQILAGGKNSSQSAPEFHLFVGGDKTLALIVGYTTFPADIEHVDPNRSIDIIRDGLVKDMQLTKLAESPLTIDGHPGREITAISTKSGATLNFDARCYTVGQRLYQIMAVITPDNADTIMANNFLQSFKLLPNIANEDVAGSAPKAKEYKFTEGGFSVTSLVPLTQTTQNLKSSQGDYVYVRHLFMGHAGLIYFYVAYIDSPVNDETHQPDLKLNAMRDATITGMHAKLLDERKVSIDGHPGKEYDYIRSFNTPPDIEYKTRAFLVGSKVYEVTVFAPKDTSGDSILDSFLNSFTLLPSP